MRVDKWMRVAKVIGEDNNPCYSRKIGVVIVNPITNKLKATGYNGPPPKTPHCDDIAFYEQYLRPQLTIEEMSEFIKAANSGATTFEVAASQLAGCKICPRRLVGASSGQRSDLCSCGHAERHAVTNAECDLHGMVMICYCGVPCLQCADTIIGAGIKLVYHLDDKPDYHPQSRWLFKRGGVQLISLERKNYEDALH